MTVTDSRRSYLPRAGLYVGILGAVNFVVFVLLYLEDWTYRYYWIIAFIPLPFIILLLAQKKSCIGGVLLIALGIVALIIGINLSIGIVGQVAGIGLNHIVGLGYTIVLVSLPLIISGILFILSARIHVNRQRKWDSYKK